LKKVLVTGADGQLGLAIKAAKAAYPGISFLFTGKKDLDVTSPKQIDLFFRANRFDFCVNAAAFTNVDKAEEEIPAAYLLNETAPRLLANACKSHNVFLVHVSTDYVFDGTKGTPYTIDDTPNPINVYGASKLAGEKAIENVCCNYCIVRTSWLYSEYGTNFQTKILAKAKSLPYLEVACDLYGTPTYAPNLAVFLLNKIRDLAFVSNMEHFSDGKTMSWYDLAKQLTTVEIKTTTAIFNLKAKRPMNSALKVKT
tara:strand:+ start:9618 stop:10382 length:765 start_codon:yes stop_codon:yes gene_type:complete